MWVSLTNFCLPLVDRIALDQTRTHSPERQHHSLLHSTCSQTSANNYQHLGTKGPLPSSSMRLTLWHNLCYRASLPSSLSSLPPPPPGVVWGRAPAQSLSPALGHFPLSTSHLRLCFQGAQPQASAFSGINTSVCTSVPPIILSHGCCFCVCVVTLSM